MTTILLIIQILVAIALVAVVLMQRSEGGALGIGGGGPGGMMSGRGAANLLTRTTMILGVVFMANSIALAALSRMDVSGQSVIDRVGTQDERGPLPFSFDDDGEPIPADEAPAAETADQPADVPAPFEGDTGDTPAGADEEPGR
ncbi:preprotein translocase subunit SecG [Glycocaulis abyssi]|uniref:Protein-export membrane protein SecG n=1 Tax=Glycocaulis abyssi TaxID=1433403 RepID=A0ABV9NA00_9PROT